MLDLFSVAGARALAASPESAALWADEARQAGVVSGIEGWTERLGRRCRGHERRLQDLATPEGAEAGEDADGERLELVRRRLSAARSLQEAAAALAGAAAKLPRRAAWGAWAEAFTSLAKAVFDDETATAVADVCAGLRALEVLGEEVDIAEAGAALREQLAGGTDQTGRVGRDGVAVLTPLQARGLSFHTVAFCGHAEGGFPSRGRPDPILGDAARRVLAERLGARLPGSEAREDEALLLFAFACEATRERLTLIAPRTDAASGRPRLPSRLLLRLASLAAGRPVGMDEFLGGAPLRPVWRRVGGTDADAATPGDEVGPPAPQGGASAPAVVSAEVPSAGRVWVDGRERDAALLRVLAASGGIPAASPYLAAALEDPAAAARRVGQWQAGRSPAPGPWDGFLGEPAQALLRASHPLGEEMHPTRLERYIDCPFVFYLRYVLELEAPEEPEESLEMDPLEFGNLAHAILERTYAAVIAEGLDRFEAQTELNTAWQVCCAEAEQNGVTGVPLSWEVRRAALLADLSQIVEQDPVFASGQRPLAVEWRFGADHERPVELELPDGRTVRFAGRLDRVDEVRDGARVIDYKTGGGYKEQQRLKAGLSVQLPVYRLAVRRAGGVGEGAVTCVYRFVTRRGGLIDLPLPSTEKDGEDRLRQLVAGAMGLVDAGEFPRSTGDRCDYCDVGYACGVSAWTRARKRAHPGLAEVVALQSRPPRDGG